MSDISFNHIPVNLLVPGVRVEFDNTRAVSGLVTSPNRLLLFTPMLDEGTAEANKPLQITNAAAGVDALGRGSIGAGMVKAEYEVTDTIETWIVPVPDTAAGQQAKGKIIIQGEPSENGTLNLYIGFRRIQIGVSISDDAELIAEALAEEINADPDCYVIAECDDEIVKLTCKQKGSLGNDIDLRLNFYPLDEKTPEGIAVTFTAMSGGTGDASISAGLSNIGEKQYSHIICAFNDSANLALLKTELEDRWGPLRQIDGRGHAGYRGTVGSLNAYLSAHNNPHITVWTSETGGEPSPVWEKAARAGTVSAYYLAIDPARPLKTLALAGHAPAPESKRFTNAERNQILWYGGATTTVDDDGNVCIERAVTTYKTNKAGIVDPSYRDIQTLSVLSQMRYSLRARLTQLYPRHSLADDDDIFPPGLAIVQPKTMKVSVINLAYEWKDAGWLEDIDGFIRDLVVQRNSKDKNTMDIIMSPNIVNMLNSTHVQMQFIL